MGKGEEGKIDQGELPESPLCVLGGVLIKLWFGEGLRIKNGPASPVLDNYRGKDDEGNHHDNGLDCIGKCDTIQSTGPFKEQNQCHDDDDRISCVGIKLKDTVECTLDGDDLSGKINDGWEDL